MPLFLLRSILDTRKEQLYSVLTSLVAGATDATIDPLCDFLLDFHEVQSPHRSIRLGANDLAAVLMWRRTPPAPAAASTSAGPNNTATSAATSTAVAPAPSAANTADMPPSEATGGPASTGPINTSVPPPPIVAAISAHPIRKLLDDAAASGSALSGLSAKVQSKLGQLLALLEQSNLPESTQTSTAPTSTASELAEPALPAADGIVQQFAARPICQVVVESTTFSAADFWPATDADAADEPMVLDTDDDKQQQFVACDMVDVMKQCLLTQNTAGGAGSTGAGAPATPGAPVGIEPNLAGDCKRLLHLSASPQSQRERTQAAPCFRTRRVELEPPSAAGRPDKKIYGEAN